MAQVRPVKQQEVQVDHMDRLEGSVVPTSAAFCSLLCFVGILLVRRYVPKANKHWLCRTPHVCVGSLVLVTFLQCSVMVLRSSHVKEESLRPAVHAEDTPQQFLGVDAQDSLEDLPDLPETTPSEEVPCRQVTPFDFGAKGDGHADDSAPVLSAILHGAKCQTEVIIPSRRFLVMPTLQVTVENVTIIFEGVLVGPSLQAWNPLMGTWPKGSCAYAEAGCRLGGPSPEFARSQWALLLFRNCRNVTLRGRGGLEARGPSFWKVRNLRPQVRGYCLLKMEDCESMEILGLHLHDSPMYQVVVARSRWVRLDGLRITLSNHELGDAGAHNTDGVNILNSSEVTLQRSVIESGDDNVVVKEGSHDIYGEDLQLRRGKGVSIGSLGERSAEGQVVMNVRFRNLTVTQSVHGARIKTWKGAQGLVRNVSFESFKLLDVMVGILIDQTYCPPSQRPEGCENDGEAIRIERVRFSDFSGSFLQTDRKVLCNACEDVTYQNIALRPAAPMFRPR
ncbi:unnamed protein product [Effrenium voratum]|uniref:Polygalacturonase n=1 Tax=Effrenium voratum TaxID=2562239 RepID=A0AA36HUF6_9DINO|nr:unnamed protein product [Effrenium voratum]CAJ1461884.1 unnamed protein product [Effrenium voratum]